MTRDLVMEHDKETKEWNMTKGRENGAGQRDKENEQDKGTREWNRTKEQGNGA